MAGTRDMIISGCGRWRSRVDDVIVERPQDMLMRVAHVAFICGTSRMRWNRSYHLLS